MYLQGQLLRNKKELDKRATMPGGEELETIHLLHHHHQGPLKGMERKRGERLGVLVYFFVCFIVIKGTWRKEELKAKRTGGERRGMISQSSRSLVELDDCIAGSGHEQRGRCTVQNPVNAGYVALEVVLATEEASAHLTWESWWKSALVAHVPHQIL